MKIVQVNLQHDFGGAEQHVLTVSNGLSERGHEVTVFAHPDGKLPGKAREIGLNVVEIAMRNQMDLKGGARLTFFLEKLRPDVLHLHTPKDYVGGVMAARLAGVKAVVMTRHMLLPVKPKMRRIYNATNAVVCLSQGVRDNLREQQIREEKLRLILGAIDVAEFEGLPDRRMRATLRNELELRPDRVGIGVIGRLVGGKGHDVLLQAFARLNLPSARLFVVGEGPLRQTLEARAAELGIAEAVSWLGFRADIVAVLNALDIVVLPSDESEVFPLILMEAMAASCAVVASRIGGVPEIVEDEQTGLLVTPGDVQDLADALYDVIMDADVRKQMGINGKRRAEKHFSMTRFLDQTEQLYEKLTGIVKEVEAPKKEEI